MKKYTVCILLVVLLFAGCRASLRSPVKLKPETVIAPITQTNYVSKEILLVSPEKSYTVKQTIPATNHNGKINLEIKIISPPTTNHIILTEKQEKLITNNFLLVYFSVISVIGFIWWAFFRKKKKSRE